MSFLSILNKTKKGISLSEKEVNLLAVKLRLNTSIFSLFIRMTISLIFFIIGIVVFFEIENEIIKYSLLFIFVSLILFVMIFKNNKYKIIEYLEAVDEFYLEYFKEFKDMESIFLVQEFKQNENIFKKICIFFTNGYEFYICDDLLKETVYPLPKKFSSSINKYPYLKVFNDCYINKKTICFNLSEIENYVLFKPFNEFKKNDTLGDDYRKYTFTFNEKILSNYCIIKLKDKRTFKLSPEVIRILRDNAPSKEGV